MDGWDWLIYFGLIAIWARSYFRVSKVIKTFDDEGREFGSVGLWWISIFFLPWAIRQAEKDYVEDNKKVNDRISL